MSKRVEWIDVAKGIGILLVCLGHTRLGLGGFIASWITSFHMPLFFVAAGLCYDEGRYASYGQYCERKIKALGCPYLGLSLFVVLGTALFSGQCTWGTLKEQLFGYYPGQCVIGFWFVRVLFLVELAYALVHRVSTCWRCVLILILFVVGFLLPEVHEALRINVVCLSLFYYAMGVFLRGALRREFSLRRLVAVLSCTACVHAGMIVFCGCPVSNYGGAVFPSGSIVFVGLFVLGITMLFASSMLIDRIPHVRKPFAWLGRYSLLLLAIHPMSGICRSVWVKEFVGLSGWKSYALEILLIAVLMALLAGPIKFIWKWPFRKVVKVAESN